MRSLQQLIYYTVLVMAGILMFSLLKETLSCNDKSQEEKAAADSTVLYQVPTPSEPKEDVKSSKEKLLPKKEKEGAPEKACLFRYQEHKGKVLLSSEESVERERLLSHRDSCKTPFQRLIESESLSDEQKKTLTDYKNALNPFHLRAELEAKLGEFRELLKLQNTGLIAA